MGSPCRLLSTRAVVVTSENRFFCPATFRTVTTRSSKRGSGVGGIIGTRGTAPHGVSVASPSLTSAWQPIWYSEMKSWCQPFAFLGRLRVRNLMISGSSSEGISSITQVSCRPAGNNHELSLLHSVDSRCRLLNQNCTPELTKIRKLPRAGFHARLEVAACSSSRNFETPLHGTKEFGPACVTPRPLKSSPLSLERDEEVRHLA